MAKERETERRFAQRLVKEAIAHGAARRGLKSEERTRQCGLYLQFYFSLQFKGIRMFLRESRCRAAARACISACVCVCATLIACAAAAQKPNELECLLSCLRSLLFVPRLPARLSPRVRFETRIKQTALMLDPCRSESLARLSSFLLAFGRRRVATRSRLIRGRDARNRLSDAIAGLAKPPQRTKSSHVL